MHSRIGIYFLLFPTSINPFDRPRLLSMDDQHPDVSTQRVARLARGFVEYYSSVHGKVQELMNSD
jgi:hypothetical protein